MVYEKTIENLISAKIFEEIAKVIGREKNSDWVVLKLDLPNKQEISWIKEGNIYRNNGRVLLDLLDESHYEPIKEAFARNLYKYKEEGDIKKFIQSLSASEKEIAEKMLNNLNLLTSVV